MFSIKVEAQDYRGKYPPFHVKADGWFINKSLNDTVANAWKTVPTRLLSRERRTAPPALTRTKQILV
jgi:hypothetical protein